MKEQKDFFEKMRQCYHRKEPLLVVSKSRHKIFGVINEDSKLLRDGWISLTDNTGRKACMQIKNIDFFGMQGSPEFVEDKEITWVGGHSPDNPITAED